jgi:hypothetical protein
MRSGDISQPATFPQVSPPPQSHYRRHPRALLSLLDILPPSPPPVLHTLFRAQPVPTFHSLPTPSCLHTMFASLLCPRPLPVPLHSSSHQVARAHQSRPKGTPVPADPSLLQPASVSVLGSERDQVRAIVVTMARRRVPPQYALAYFGLMLS